ncbi:hypothetical protein, partial [Streptomyces tsukubensis]|uniref:hypothetical protein n=1 Tax=Streptomyces tsukubensis TaxID=83656 RepID=UPI00344BB1D7
MSYNSLDRHGREDAAGTREDLAELGITTTVSQIARHDRALSAWRGGRLSLLGLCAATGWETDRLRPTYWEHPDRGWVVLMTLADLEAARNAARERNRAGGEPPLCGVWANRRSDDTPMLVSLPVVTVVRRSKTPREQLLTGPAWQITDHPGLVAAEKPANRPHRPD